MAERKMIRVALAGNPNVGKTTIFNAITGARQHVGNWPGVTVEKKVGMRNHRGVQIEVVDLPGTYSLTAYSMDEIIARDFIIEEKPNVVVHIVDATNLERNLYLTTQLMELGVRIVIALNMSDLAKRRGDQIDIQGLQSILEIPVIETIGSEEKGIEELLDEIIREAEKGEHHEHAIGYGDEIEEKISLLEDVISRDSQLSEKYPARWIAVKLLEGDENVFDKLRESPIAKAVEGRLKSMEMIELEAAMADKRYEVIGSVLHLVLKMTEREMSFSDMIDRVVTNKYLGIPIFLALMWGAFELTFTFAAPFMDLIDLGFAGLSTFISENIQVDWLASFLGDGLVSGVGIVLVFIPNIFILFLLLSFLEDSGYLARAAFIMDKLMYKIGLHGRSFIPMLMGFGCNVPAIMATRTIESEKDRLVSILVNPFISCGARLPVYVLLAGAFFGREAGTVIFVVYALGIVVAVLSAKLFRSTLFRGPPSPFIMELPPYRMPTLKTSGIHMWQRGSMYLKKAGTIILVGAIAVWFLASFPWGVQYGGEASLAGQIGHIVSPILEPLGFNWKIAVALIFGFLAKEIVIGSLGVLYGSADDEQSLAGALRNDESFFALNAFALMVFVLIYTPCLATVGVMRKETGSWKWTLFQITYSVSLAWFLALMIFQIGSLLGLGG